MKTLKNRINESMSINEKFEATEKRTMIMIGDFPWYLEKMGDSTHFYFANSIDGIEKGWAMAHHIGQHRSEGYYDDVRSWLKNGISSDELNGRKYKDSNAR